MEPSQKLEQQIQEIENDMKFDVKKNGIIVLMTLFHWTLFYNQDYGINYLLFSILIFGALIIQNTAIIKNAMFYLFSGITLITSIATFYYGFETMAYANIISVFVLCSFAIAPKSSILTLIFQYLFTLATTFYTLFIDLVQIKNTEINVLKKAIKYFLLSIIPIFIALIFLGIYAISNPILSNLLDKIDLTFISISGIFYFLYSFYLIYSHFRENHIKLLNTLEIEYKNDLTKHNDSFFSKLLSLKSELFIAFFVLILLNLIIGFQNGLDIYFIFFKKVLPEKLSYSQYIHNGVNALILSIVLAILVIMALFNSKISFYKNAKYVKSVAYLWIVQNIILAYICFFKNQEYIIHFGYTHKRIGVYVFLLLCIIGLLLTTYKVFKNKNNLFLFRKNSLSIYVIIMLYICVDWSAIIAKSQLKRAANPDFEYILSQEYTALPYLYNYLKIDKENVIKLRQEKDSMNIERLSKELDIKLNTIQKMDDLAYDYNSKNWPSYCYKKKEIVNRK